MSELSSSIACRAQALLATACLAAAAVAPAGVQAASSPAGDETAASSALRGYYDRLRGQLRWVPARVDGRQVLTPDAKSRLLLARSAAERAGLADVGLDFRDVYGVISAETSWVPRDGIGRNGVISQGLAQLEPATARALGVRDANDAVEAVHAAATLLKEAAHWSARRIAGLQLDRTERAARLREGVSIYYNLSTAGRARWDGSSTDALPLETRRHIHNVRAGALQAERLHAGGAPGLEPLAMRAAADPRPVRPVAAAAQPAGARVLGTIEWSGQGADADGKRAGRHVVWSNGSVTREGGGRVRWTSDARRNG